MSSINKGIFQCWAPIPVKAEAVTPGEPVVICAFCTIRKAVVYMLTVIWAAGSLKFATKVTGPPVEGLG